MHVDKTWDYQTPAELRYLSGGSRFNPACDLRNKAVIADGNIAKLRSGGGRYDGSAIAQQELWRLSTCLHHFSLTVRYLSIPRLQIPSKRCAALDAMMSCRSIRWYVAR